MQDLTTRAVVLQLLAYADLHPCASDSAAGIQRWWLDPTRSVDVQTLTRALNWLVARGVFSEHVASDGRCSYRRIASDAQLQQLLVELRQAPPAGDDTPVDSD